MRRKNWAAHDVFYRKYNCNIVLQKTLYNHLGNSVKISQKQHKIASWHDTCLCHIINIISDYNNTRSIAQNKDRSERKARNENEKNINNFLLLCGDVCNWSFSYSKRLMWWKCKENMITLACVTKKIFNVLLLVLQLYTSYSMTWKVV